MYKAKQAGRATYRFFSADMNRLAEQRLVLAQRCAGASRMTASSCDYQPQTRTVDGSFYGVEALARWHDPVLGDVPPAKFIPLAEECGLIEQIGLWSIREACRQMAHGARPAWTFPAWRSICRRSISRTRGSLPSSAETIASNGLPPEALMLEVTESVFMNEHSVAIETMNAIRKLGIGLSLDDFGTGYSSLNRLAHLPIRELKIDRSFMRNVESDASALAIATTVVRVGQSLKLTVVAEGVETEGQRKLLSELGCEVMQGYLCAPAMSPERSTDGCSTIAPTRRDAAAKRRRGPFATDAVVADCVHGRVDYASRSGTPLPQIVTGYLFRPCFSRQLESARTIQLSLVLAG